MGNYINDDNNFRIKRDNHFSRDNCEADKYIIIINCHKLYYLIWLGARIMCVITGKSKDRVYIHIYNICVHTSNYRVCAKTTKWKLIKSAAVIL